VHAAEAARREDPDADPGREPRRRRDRGRAGASERRRRREVAHRQLQHLRRVRGDPFQAGGVEPDGGDAAEHGDGRGDRPAGPDQVLQLTADLAVARRGQPVRQQRRLQRDDCSSGGQRVRYLGGHLDVGHGLTIGPDARTAR
jgi:hypothetical protein